jgi:hypothetical protein
MGGILLKSGSRKKPNIPIAARVGVTARDPQRPAAARAKHGAAAEEIYLEK